MFEVDDLPIETSPGHRPDGSGGERLIVALAAVVLLGALLIIGSRWLPRDGTADGEHSPAAQGSVKPTPTATPQPTATPPPVVVTLLPGTPPTPASPEPPQFSGWLRAKVALTIFQEPNGATSTGLSLAAGDLANGWEDSSQPGWLQIQDPVYGWVYHTLAGADTFEPISVPAVTWPGGVWSIVATQDGFVGEGVAPTRSDTQQSTFVIVSRDGSRWSAQPRGLRPDGPVVHGPAGWLGYTTQQAPGSDFETAVVWMMSSPDAVRWSVLGAWIDPGEQPSFPSQLVGTPQGYLMSTSEGRRAGTVWFSSDGVAWTGTGVGAFRGSLQAVSSDAGTFAWSPYDGYFGNSEAAQRALYSTDGTTWSVVDGNPDRASMVATGRGREIVAIDRDPNSGVSRVWTGAVTRGEFGWRLEPTAATAFEGSVVTALVTSGERVVAFGWDRESEAALTWTREGGHWRRSALPTAFGGFPRVAAGGPAGVVVVGYRVTTRGMNPVIWHETAEGGWLPEASPVIALAPDPDPAQCPPAPRDALDFILLDRQSWVACSGASPFTVRIWATRCAECYGEQTWRREPAWLAEPTDQQLFLSPLAHGQPGNSWVTAVLPPNLALDHAWEGHLLELTGHFDDPAATSCRWDPSLDELQWYDGTATVIDACRQSFVVTAVRDLGAP